MHLTDPADSVTGSPDQGLYRPQSGRDLLQLPILGSLLQWRYGRLALQIPLLLMALLLIYDGFTGPRLASQNLATVSVWVHFRGLAILVLILVGNLFCMACPFTIPRSLALRLGRHHRRWPRALRNKWLAVAALAGFLFLYEWLDLWASPWLTAWLIVAYFLSAFVLEAFFDESPFCKYICPLGTFNFVAATAAPTRISVANLDTCRDCEGKECVNGSPSVLGCGTELFPPALSSNLDCVLCLDCARACPYDNVTWNLRPPGEELEEQAWPRRWDVSFMVMVFAFAALANAFGMVPPYYELQLKLASLLGTESELLLLALIFGIAMLLLPAVTGLAAAWISRVAAGLDEPLRHSFTRFAPAYVPVAVAIWLAHYGFHFATGALALIPVFHSFLIDHGIMLLGETPDWALGPILPWGWLLPLQTFILLAGFAWALWVSSRIVQRQLAEAARPHLAAIPWIILLALLAMAALATFNLPMEMRGVAIGPG